jgi:hypothetical protein
MLIDAVVRQTTVLIAQLATSGGGRAQLTHTANQVFVDLVEALKEQGLGNKVIADMFGLALRTYHSKVQRLTESRTDRGRSLWEALFDYVRAHGPVSREQVLRRFGADDPLSVRGVLKDLVDSGMVYRTGRGDRTHYQAAPDSTGSGEVEASDHLVWLTVHRLGPLTESDICQALSLDDEHVAESVERLLRGGNIRRSESQPERLVSDGCVLAIDDPKGWEVAVFDHYQAMVAAMCTKLRLGKTQASAGELIGGSTFSFRVWPGHAHYDEATNVLAEFRARVSELRNQIAAYNKLHSEPADGSMKVIVYAGQTVTGLEELREDDDDE